MSVLLIIVIFGVIIGGHGALINHCTSLLPSLYIVPHRSTFPSDKENILDEQLRPVLVIEKVQGLPTGTTSVYLRTPGNDVLYQITAMERGAPRGQRQVIIRASNRIVPLFIQSEGSRGSPSFAMRAQSDDGQFSVVRCVDTLLYRYQIENEFTRATEAHVVRMTVPLGHLNTHTISFRSPAQQNKAFITAMTMAMDELLL